MFLRVGCVLTVLMVFLVSPILGVAQSVAQSVAQTDPPAELPPGEDAVVTRVIDGDTIQVRIGSRTHTVRYIGVDAPEAGQRQRCFADEATAFNKSLVMASTSVVSNTIRLVRDVSETDRYGRLLRYVYLSDGRMVNEELVRAGYAQVATYPPDVKHQERFLAAQRAARASGAGLWTACAVTPTPTPVPTRLPGAACPRGCTEPLAGCAIKGNISKSGEKIYHRPGQRDYEATVISPDKGERWFCTPEEASANGWRAAKR